MSTAAGANQEGCSLLSDNPDDVNRGRPAAGGTRSNWQSLEKTTHVPALDRALDAALVRLAEMFQVRPGFAFYDDGNRPNAWATTQPLQAGTTGAVIFGKKLFKGLMEHDPSGIAVLWVIAHEFGHIAMFESGQFQLVKGNLKSSKRIELHADFMAGYFLGARKIDHPNASLYKAGQAIWDIGDFDFNNPAHHGTPSERVAAAEAGFRVSFFDGKDAREAFRLATAYVSNIS